MTALCEEDLDVHDPVEVHWSTSTILAIFFAASLISAVFFGLGYSFGGAGTLRRSIASNSAPASGSAIGSAALQTSSNHVAELRLPATIPSAASNASPHAAESAQPAPRTEIREVVTPRPAPPSAPIAEKKVTPAVAFVQKNATISEKSSGHIMVQVGAIGDRKDAERLVAELRKKGFHAGIYLEKQDKFLHVQIGPFRDAQQAQFERHRVMASGFRAILKGVS